MTNFGESKYVKKMCEITQASYRNGWDERNGGNVSYRLLKEEIASFDDTTTAKRTVVLNFDAKELAGQYFLVTGTGRYFRNVISQPKLDLGLVQITNDGKKVDILWGFEDGATPTSEFPSHLMSHIERLKKDPNQRVVMHCHPTNLIALSFTQDLNEKSISRLLWKMQAESLVVFPEGIGILPYMTPGTTEIGKATADKMKKFRVVMWPHHGIFGVGDDLDEAFGLIETVEKAANIFSQIGSQGSTIKQEITDEQLRDLATAFKVKANPEFLPEYSKL